MSGYLKTILLLLLLLHHPRNPGHHQKEEVFRFLLAILSSYERSGLELLNGQVTHNQSPTPLHHRRRRHHHDLNQRKHGRAGQSASGAASIVERLSHGIGSLSVAQLPGLGEVGQSGGQQSAVLPNQLLPDERRRLSARWFASSHEGSARADGHRCSGVRVCAVLCSGCSPFRGC
uniref:Putative secreted protein n=1 Tax=Anopheles darlingi TaxID=43151 RepID=A0A2M4DK15_ANODA